MTLVEFSQMVGNQIEIRSRMPGLALWYAYIAGAEVKRAGGMLLGVTGNGRTPEEALREYIAAIRGERLVIDACGDRREFNVPDTLNGIGGGA